jgi:AcrR family transcriptional regulator
MAETDRRVQRTRELLRGALIELIGERGYDGITVQDIVDRANVGRTTFYLHYNSKDDLFLSCHETIVSGFESSPFYTHPLSRDELLAPEAPAGMRQMFQHLKEAGARLDPIFQGRDGGVILRRIRDGSAQEIEANLQTAFAGARSAIPLEVLASYLAGAKLALVQWWLEKRRPHSPEAMARAFHRLQRAAILDAFRIPHLGDQP